MQKASDRYMKMENNNHDKEKILFATKKLWNRDELEENKYKLSLSYLLDKLTHTVHNQNPSPLLFRLMNMIFFKKIK